jgi:hypothetical protein
LRDDRRRDFSGLLRWLQVPSLLSVPVQSLADSGEGRWDLQISGSGDGPGRDRGGEGHWAWQISGRSGIGPGRNQGEEGLRLPRRRGASGQCLLGVEGRRGSTGRTERWGTSGRRGATGQPWEHRDGRMGNEA